MISQMNLATMLAAIAGILQGSFVLPMKKMEREWRWENTWLIYSIVGLIILPCWLAYLTIPSLVEVYSIAPWSSIGAVLLFGLGWGLGSTLFGMGVSRVGMALAFAFILGLTSSFGSLLPLMVQTPAELFTSRGIMLLISLLLVIGGIVLLSRAGLRRERERGRASDSDPGDFRTGMLICIASGLLSPMLNFSFVFGKPLQDAAIVFGARPDLAANAIWAPALAVGFLPNALYPLYLLRKNKTWGRYAAGWRTVLYALGASAMGLLWYGGVSLYGAGAAMMGPLGAVLGWPIFMSMNIIAANVLGAATGEWSGTSPAARGLSWAGIGVLIVAIIVVALAGQV